MSDGRGVRAPLLLSLRGSHFTSIPMNEAAPGTPAPTDEFTTFWNTVLVPKFERYRNILLDGLSYHSDVPLRGLVLEPGSHVIDVGCGWGDTAIALAWKVGATGSVLGLDCCDAFMQKGRDDARAAGIDNVTFVEADVQTYRFPRRYDFCFSRFGMMFFANPVAAMRNIRSALEPGGRLMFIVWRALDDNPVFSLPKKTVLEFLPPPGENAQTCGPGPFSMANPEVVTAQLKAAGFEAAEFTRTDGDVMVGASVEQAVDFQLALGPAGEIFREAGAQALARQREIEEALRASLARYLRDGRVIMPSSSWTIVARNPRSA
jgi:SAM-dependent methyltransferase